MKLAVWLGLALPFGAASGEDLAARIAAHPPRPQFAPGQDRGEVVQYRGGVRPLKGRLYKPAGAGPFPAMVWNHGSEPSPGPQPELAAFYTARGYLFFTPHREGHGLSPGDYIVDRNSELIKLHPGRMEEAWRQMVPLHDRANADVDAALEWLKRQPFADAKRIVMSGVSYGGIQTLLSAEKGGGVRAFVSFAPAAMSWRMLPLRERLLRAIAGAKTPVFLLQAANDYSTGPVEVLGEALRRKGPPNRAKLYPAFGPADNHQKGHAAFATWDLGAGLWGPDVLPFLDAALR
jgi:carboxymethylenebutenolidase